jgi:hypothetical protein
MNTGMMVHYPESFEQILRFDFCETSQTITVIKRLASNGILACNPPRPAPDTIWREVYGIRDGQLKLIKSEQGEHIPAHHVAEQFNFPD